MITDGNLIYYVAAAVALVGGLIVFWAFRNQSQRMALLADGEEFDAALGENPDGEVVTSYASVRRTSEVFDARKPATKKSAKPPKRQKKKWLERAAASSDCKHNFEITGFPADKLGTHVNIRCTKCGAKMTVTIEESRELMRMRDDVREAIERSKG